MALQVLFWRIADISVSMTWGSWDCLPSLLNEWRQIWHCKGEEFMVSTLAARTGTCSEQAIHVRKVEWNKHNTRSGEPQVGVDGRRKSSLQWVKRVQGSVGSRWPRHEKCLVLPGVVWWCWCPIAKFLGIRPLDCRTWESDRQTRGAVPPFPTNSRTIEMALCLFPRGV